MKPNVLAKKRTLGSVPWNFLLSLAVTNMSAIWANTADILEDLALRMPR